MCIFIKNSGMGGRGGPGGRGGRGGRGQWRDRIDRQASVSVRPDWRRVEEVDLGKLSKGTSPLSALVDNSPPKDVTDLIWAGFLDQYNDQYDKVSTRTPAPLKRVETKEFYPVTTTDDPVIEKLAIEGKGTVFATDAILAHLMTCPRSVYPWALVSARVCWLSTFKVWQESPLSRRGHASRWVFVFLFLTRCLDRGKVVSNCG